MEAPLRLGIMLSGSGTTYACLAEAIASGRLEAMVCRVISSKVSAGGVERARGYGHPVSIVNPRDRGVHAQIAKQFEDDGVELVVLAGYMHLWELPPAYRDRTINIHPALIPAFCGKGMYGHHVHEAVIASGVKVSGCTVHLVDGKYDHGRILEQRVVQVESGDSPETLAARVQLTEKALLLHVIRRWNDTYRPS